MERDSVSTIVDPEQMMNDNFPLVTPHQIHDPI